MKIVLLVHAVVLVLGLSTVVFLGLRRRWMAALFALTLRKLSMGLRHGGWAFSEAPGVAMGLEPG